MSKKIKRTELDSYEVYILGLTILGENTEDEEKVDADYFYDVFESAGIEIDFCSFKEIVCRLFPLIDVAKDASPVGEIRTRSSRAFALVVTKLQVRVLPCFQN